MRFSFDCAFALVLGTSFGCSSTDTGSTTPAVTQSTGGNRGSGGGTSSGTGGASTGGKDPKDCAADSGTEACRQCLAANCCSAYANCVRDAACARALEDYRQCANTAVSGSDKGSCLSTFSRVMKDAGASSAFGNAVGQCVYAYCAFCGAPFI